MKPYPQIPGGVRQGVPVYVFDKLDGSCTRAEWTRKRGFFKFGKRHGLLDPGYDTTPHLSTAPGLIMDKYADDLAEIGRSLRWNKATYFFEFHGPNSFAGGHADEPHTVTLLDVSVHRKGFVAPKDFMKLFGHLDLPRLLHQGNFTQDLAEQVSGGTLEA